MTIILTCNYCQCDYKVIPSREFISKYCSMECKAKAMKILYFGDNNPMYGKPRNDLSERNKTQSQIQAVIKYNTGRKRSEETKRKIGIKSRESNLKLGWWKGKSNPFFTGNPEACSRKYWISKKLRKYVLERDNYTCQNCLQQNPKLTVHHIIPRRDGGTNDLTNLKTLCFKCHMKIDYLIIKSDKHQ